MTSQPFDWRMIFFLILAWVMSPRMKFPEGLLCKNVSWAGFQMSFETTLSKPDFSKPVLKPPHPENKSIDLSFFIWITKDYILYSGSYLYSPNKNAIDYLNNRIMPILLSKHPEIKLVLTGGGFKKKYPWIINKNIVPKKELYNLIYHSKCFCVPLKFGAGTRIKIIEALSIGAIVISSLNKEHSHELLSKLNFPFIKKGDN